MQKHFQYFQKRIAYRVIGKGKPVVLLHGFGEDSHIWDRQITYLQDHCQLIVPDLPGSGLSELMIEKDLKKPINESISIVDYADLIRAILQAENISSGIMLGHSMGGYITLAFAKKYPEILRKFGLVHSSAFADTDEKKANRLKGIELMKAYGAAPFLKNIIPNLFATRFKKEHPEMLLSLIEASEQFSTEACQQYYRAMMNREDRTDILKSYPNPILFLIGTEDIAAPLIDLLPQIKMPMHPHTLILDDVGHMGMWEASEQVNQLLLEFIQQ